MEEALNVLRSGGVILYPTDTVWGIGCDATNEQAVARVYSLKGRKEEKAVIMLVENLDNVARYVHSVPEMASELITANDGNSPLTLILEGGCGVAANALPAEKTIAIRIPNHQFCIDMLHKLRRPIVSTSANISGEPTPTTFDEISDAIKNGVDYIVPRQFEGHPTGKPSSIIAVGEGAQIKIIRAG